MSSLYPVLFTFAILLSAIASFENVTALPVSATHGVRYGMSYTTSDRSNLTQIRLSREALMDPLANYTDEEVTNDPTVFSNLTEYEFLQELRLEGINSSEDVVESLSDTKYEGRVSAPADCEALTNTTYYYYRCTDPAKRELPFSEYKGLGYCPPRRTRRTYRLRYSTPRRTSSSHRRTYSTKRRTYSPRHRSLSTVPSTVRILQKRGHPTFTGYRYIRKHTTKLCGATYGLYLQQVVSEFVLKGKKARYQKVIERTFQRIRRRYRGFQYLIQSETYEKNGKVYVKFFFNEKHTREAEV